MGLVVKDLSSEYTSFVNVVQAYFGAHACKGKCAQCGFDLF